MEEKSPKNCILLKGHSLMQNKSSVTKLELVLYYVNANSYAQFQVNIIKDGRKKNPDNEMLAKGSTSFKSRSNATKLKIDRYYVKKTHKPNFKSKSQLIAEKSPEN